MTFLTKKYFGAPVWLWGAGVVVLAFGAKKPVLNALQQRKLDALHPEMKRRVERWISALRSAGYDVTITETQRSADRQVELEAGGASTVKTSYHQSGLGIDFAVVKDPAGSITPFKESARELAALKAVAAIAKPLGMRWGGDWKMFKDSYHLELDTPLTMVTALDRYKIQGQNWQPLSGVMGSGLFQLSTSKQRYVREV